MKTLFSRTATGAIQTWRMEIEDGKYRTIHGQLDGKLVTTDWTVCGGKNLGRANETSPNDQAIKEVKAAYKYQLKSGYHENMLDIDKPCGVPVMLAKKFNDRIDKIVYPVGVQTKLNGQRQIVVKDGPFTRENERILTAPHIFKALAPLVKAYPDLVLDGELYNHDYRYKLNELMKITRATKNISPSLLAESEQKVKYYVYDGFGFDKVTKNSGYEQRSEGIRKLLKDIPYIVLVDTLYAHSEAEVQKFYNGFIEAEYEGAMVRILGVPYEDKRSSYLLKLKPTDDAEFIILDINEGSGNWAGKAKIITLQMDNGKIFDASFKGNMTDATTCLNEKNRWIGKKVTVFYNGLTGKGTPNFAQFDYNNCIKEHSR